MVKGTVAAFLLIAAAHGSAQSMLGQAQWITTLGPGNAEIVKFDAQGHIFFAGSFAVQGFPVTPNAFDPNPPVSSYPGVFYQEGFLLEMDSTGTEALYATYLGGINPKDIAIDSAGFIYVIADHVEPNTQQIIATGCCSISYPVAITPGAAQSVPGIVSTPVLLKIAPSGSLVYSTFFGGISAVSGGFAVDSTGAAVVCGTTGDPGLPASAGAFQQNLVANGNAFVARISPDGAAFEALTYFGGTGVTNCRDLKLDANGNVVLYGDTDSQTLPLTPGAYQSTERGRENLFVVKLDSNLQHLLSSTYIGSSGTDNAQFLRVEPDGSILLAGATQSMDFPASPGTAPPYILNPPPGFINQLETRPFVARLDASGTQLLSAYVLPLGGSWTGVSDVGDSFFAVGPIATPQNLTLNAPALNVVSPYVPPMNAAGGLLRFDSGLQALTFLGPINDLPSASGSSVAWIGSSGSVLVAGFAQGGYPSAGVPVHQIGPAASSVLVSLDFNASTEPLPSVTQVVNPASWLPGPPAPGQLIQVRALGLTATSGAQVIINAQTAPVLSVQNGSILALAPANLGATFSLALQIDGKLSPEYTIASSAANPALFTAAGTGSGPALALNPAGTVNAPGHPVLRGNSITLIATGLGALDTSGQPLAQTTAQIDGMSVNISSVGPANGYPGGYYAVVVAVPASVSPGDFVPAQIEVGGVASQPGVTVSVR